MLAAVVSNNFMPKVIDHHEATFRIFTKFQMLESLYKKQSSILGNI